MATTRPITRREFLKTCGASLASLGLSRLTYRDFGVLLPRPRLSIDQLPERLRSILSLLPYTYIDARGLLHVRKTGSNALAQVPLARTQWNQEYDNPWDRLDDEAPWGIVLHWYGDTDTYDRSIKGYLRGFDSLREEDGQMVRTSAHFVVGNAAPGSPQAIVGGDIGYLQTQLPDLDGTPFTGAHLGPLDFEGAKTGQNYFLKALDRMVYEKPGRRHLLQEMHYGEQLDPNLRTIGIEISGFNFDAPKSYPQDQKIASVVSLVLALMRRYNLPARALLGHYELQTGKPDPGKQFLALIRLLLGVQALLEDDPLLWELVFDDDGESAQDPVWVVWKYFKFVRDYLLITATPRTLYDWESRSAYWWLTDLLPGKTSGMAAARDFRLPVGDSPSLLGDTYLEPGAHEGLDLYCGSIHSSSRQKVQTVQLIAKGQCLYLGGGDEYHGGQRAIFRHRQPDGAEILSIYGHLEGLQPLKVGSIYPAGMGIGHIGRPGLAQQPFLHFALGYASSWETYLIHRPYVPLNAGESWVQQRFIDPANYDYHNYVVLSPGTESTVLFGK